MVESCSASLTPWVHLMMYCSLVFQDKPSVSTHMSVDTLSNLYMILVSVSLLWNPWVKTLVSSSQVQILLTSLDRVICFIVLVWASRRLLDYFMLSCRLRLKHSWRPPHPDFDLKVHARSSSSRVRTKRQWESPSVLTTAATTLLACPSRDHLQLAFQQLQKTLQDAINAWLPSDLYLA